MNRLQFVQVLSLMGAILSIELWNRSSAHAHCTAGTFVINPRTGLMERCAGRSRAERVFTPRAVWRPRVFTQSTVARHRCTPGSFVIDPRTGLMMRCPVRQRVALLPQFDVVVRRRPVRTQSRCRGNPELFVINPQTGLMERCRDVVQTEPVSGSSEQ